MCCFTSSGLRVLILFLRFWQFWFVISFQRASICCFISESFVRLPTWGPWLGWSPSWRGWPTSAPIWRGRPETENLLFNALQKILFQRKVYFSMWCIKHYLTSILHVKSENLTLLFNVLQESSKTYFPNYNLSLYFTFQYVAFKFLFCRLKWFPNFQNIFWKQRCVSEIKHVKEQGDGRK